MSAQFFSKQNIKLLWDIIVDEFNVNLNNKDLTNNVKIVFDRSISLFKTKANPKYPLIELNKRFLRDATIAMNCIFPNLKNTKLIHISDEPVKIEDIQNLRQQTFDMQMKQKQKEFDMYSSAKKPAEIDFSDKPTMSEYENIPIDMLVSERAKDYDSVTLTLSDTDISLNQTQKKVTWLDTDNISDSTTMNIFDKLKRKKSENEVSEGAEKDTNKEIETNMIYENRKYEMPNQKNMHYEHEHERIPNSSLSNINTTTSTVITQQKPIIPGAELAKQLNDMNAKINELYIMYNELKSLIDK